ncbi:hypothetical protein KAR91_56625 [Candidatus Pacearchaeota archaeon]|nr:hypothetical protein [Candidatus Pacearchaeota archaeon]
MPIRIKYGAVGALGRAAVSAGRAQASQAQASRDIQLTSMAMAAQSRTWEIEARGRERVADRAFAMQRAASTGVARRPATGDALAERQQLKQAAIDAIGTGVYTPIQERQMTIFANLGDKVGLRGVIGSPPEPSSKQRGLIEQEQAVRDMGVRQTQSFRDRVLQIKADIDERYSAEAQEFLRENPRFIPEDVKELFIEQQTLFNQIEGAEQSIGKSIQGIRLGVPIVDQMKFEQQLAKEGRTIALREARRRADALVDIKQSEIRGYMKVITDNQALQSEKDRATGEITRLTEDIGTLLGSVTLRQATDAELKEIILQANGDKQAISAALAEAGLRE